MANWGLQAAQPYVYMAGPRQNMQALNCAILGLDEVRKHS